MEFPSSKVYIKHKICMISGDILITIINQCIHINTKLWMCVIVPMIDNEKIMKVHAYIYDLSF